MPEDSNELPEFKELTKNIKKLATILNSSEVEIRRAIHTVKRNGLPTGGVRRNPDVLVDPQTGEVYPEIEEGGVGDSIGNILDFLP